MGLVDGYGVGVGGIGPGTIVGVTGGLGNHTGGLDHNTRTHGLGGKEVTAPMYYPYPSPLYPMVPPWYPPPLPLWDPAYLTGLMMQSVIYPYYYMLILEMYKATIDVWRKTIESMLTRVERSMSGAERTS